VLIHGLNGHLTKTYTHPKTKVLWPKTLLPKRQPQTRVLSFGYSADIYHNSSIAGIRGNARSLLNMLFDYREDQRDSGRPIVFLAHSLGGLVVKQALVFAQRETQYSSIAGATRGIVRSPTFLNLH
jgi:hypothetical protein